MTDTTTPADLTSQYTERLTEDLEHNTSEQERLTAEISAMEERLAALKRDHTILLNMQQALGVTVAPTAPKDAAAVPSPRKKPAREPAKRKRTRAAATTATSGGSADAGAGKTGADAGKKTANAEEKKSTQNKKSAPKATQKPAQKSARKSATKPAAKPVQPTLVELVRAHLEQQGEPRSAAEITTALDKEHPGRAVKTTVVRTTLENLVAKNAAQRSKQGSSVFYTALTPSASTTTATTGKQGDKDKAE
ncbi:BlaI/MecI/CopY family transcriptional regulator [Streptomyces reniochalinae]|uniref:Regulatory protein n=1 Tax=Streptomyces reniochalinae TaxID=2250578 RepID=A0A367EJW8_9ACTN|nr:BlaI/MecI/CopY family transcriptional regulator [Streptomyces reniochalinae]RCG17490.1 hypothetical protein DQ392_16590 [Streptomyces reniochalinae]